MNEMTEHLSDLLGQADAAAYRLGVVLGDDGSKECAEAVSSLADALVRFLAVARHEILNKP